MNESIGGLRELFAEAAAIAATVPVPMQGAAFQSALAAIGGNHRARVASANARPAGNALTRPVSRRSTSGRRGPKAVLEQMISDGYFDTERGQSEARDYLRERGWPYEAKALATGLLRLIRDGKLVRRRGSDGVYVYARSGR